MNHDEFVKELKRKDWKLRWYMRLTEPKYQISKLYWKIKIRVSDVLALIERKK